jgi:hypothetical protein
MTARRTLLLLLSLTAAAFSASATAEPNDATTEPVFETGTWPQSRPINCDDRRARYVAEITVNRGRKTVGSSQLRQSLVKGPHSQRLSQAQKDFLADDPGMHTWTHENFVRFELFAVGEEDAKIMARALLDALSTEARRQRAAFRSELERARKELEERKVELAEKEKQFQDVEARYSKAKKDVHPGLRDDEAAQLAKELVFQMDKEAKMLDIELAGTQAKLAIIEGYLHERDLDATVRGRLEAMKIDQLIELGGLNERERAIGKIQTAEQEFYSLYSERRQLQQIVPSLRSAVRRNLDEIKRHTTELARTSGWLVPPLDAERKVTIYPI